ncbi:MAG: hypothetical protein ACJA0H_002430 [Francisellaceae bacterium]|jgi:hypothetical protein
MSKFKGYLLLVCVVSGVNIYASAPENYVLTTQKVPNTISGPSADNNGFIIKDSNTKVKKFKDQKQQGETAENKYLENQKKGVYPAIQGKQDQYGLNPSSSKN